MNLPLSRVTHATHYHCRTKAFGYYDFYSMVGIEHSHQNGIEVAVKT
jgi:hypothetical protein